MLLLAVLLPVAIYLGVLGWVNRRPRGFLLYGPWDFAGVLFAASGFLLFGGPALLSSLLSGVMGTDAWREFWLLGRKTTDVPLEERLTLGRSVAFGGYFLLMVSSAVLLLRRRRRMTAIYNVDPAVVEGVLGRSFERLRLPFVQAGNVILIDPEQVRPSAARPGAEPGRPGTNGPPPPLTACPADRLTTLEVEASPSMCHVTLLWDPPANRLRDEVERDIRHTLESRPAPGGAVGDWFLVASAGLFFLLVLGAVLLLLLRGLRV